jgi:hypothetical protein
LVEAVVGEGLAVAGEVGDEEAGFVFEELEFVEDAADGEVVGGPVEGGGELPGAVGAAFEGEGVGEGGGGGGVGGVGGGEGGDFDSGEVGGLGAEDAAAVFVDAAGGGPGALGEEEVAEEGEVEREEEEGEFRAHFF